MMILRLLMIIHFTKSMEDLINLNQTIICILVTKIISGLKAFLLTQTEAQN